MSDVDRLDLKYRPSRFADVLGNAGVVRLLLTRSRNGTLCERSMMLGGPRGCGKTSFARIIARAIHCEAPEAGEPCGACDACSAITREAFPGVEELDAASQGTVDRIRSMVRDAEYATPDGKPPVYILDEAQRLTAQAQDALLKAVEERDFIVILCTTEPSKIKVPIRSRVEEYPVSPPTQELLATRLRDVCAKEGLHADDASLSLIAKMSDLCPRSALLSLGTLASSGDISLDTVREHFRFGSYEEIVRVMALVDTNLQAALNGIDALAKTEGPVWVRDVMVAAISAGLRADVGAKSSFPVPTAGFFKNRLREWVVTARALGSIDKPSFADIEMALLEASTLLPRVQTPPQPLAPLAPVVASPPQSSLSEPVRAPEKPAPAPVPPSAPSPPPGKPAPAPVSRRSLEIGGVKFSPDENLTTLDSKVSATKPAVDVPAKSLPAVESDKAHVPIPESEFCRGLLQGFRNR